MKDLTPFEAYSGKKPSMSHLRVFGSICYVHVPKNLRHKLEENSEKFIFVVYSSHTMGYMLYFLKKKKVIICRDVIFNEEACWDWKNKSVQRFPLHVNDGI